MSAFWGKVAVSIEVGEKDFGDQYKALRKAGYEKEEIR